MHLQVKPLRPNEDPFSSTQVYVVLVSLATVVLWCCNSFIKEFTGEMGVLAIIPMVAFFGTGVLSKDDFNGFLWNVVMLAMGGLALGEAVKSSGLLTTIAEVRGEGHGWKAGEGGRVGRWRKILWIFLGNGGAGAETVNISGCSQLLPS